MLIPTIVWLLWLSLLLPFEWLLIRTTQWSYIAHLSFWVLIGSSLIALTGFLGEFIAVVSLVLVRQKKALAILYYFLILGLLLVALYSAWFSTINFSWEFLQYEITNKIIFTGVITRLWLTPHVIYAAASGAAQKIPEST